QSVGLDEFGSHNGKNRSRRRQVEPLINARIKDGPLDYMKILDRTKVEISLKDLAQMSPAARKHWKHGMSRTVGSKKEMRAGLIEKSSPSQQTMTYKSFRVNAKVETVIAGTKKIVALVINSTHVDQRTIELAKAQIATRDSQSKRSEKHVQFISESDSDNDDDDDESLIESDGSSEDSLSSGKECVAGTIPYNSKSQKRWPRDKEWWLSKMIKDGLDCGMYEPTTARGGGLSPWNAAAKLVPKSDNDKWGDEPRIAFNYHNVKEDLPGYVMQLRIPKDFTDVKSFVASFMITKPWVKNFSEIIMPLNRLMRQNAIW
ncbi:hypothetical protein EPUL_005662, partial [Erysiphe pulchra]